MQYTYEDRYEFAVMFDESPPHHFYLVRIVGNDITIGKPVVSEAEPVLRDRELWFRPPKVPMLLRTDGELFSGTDGSYLGSVLLVARAANPTVAAQRASDWWRKNRDNYIKKVNLPTGRREYSDAAKFEDSHQKSVAEEKSMEKKTMTTTKKSLKDSAGGAIALLKGSAAHGAKVALVDEAGEAFLVIAREMAGYDFTEGGTKPHMNEVAKLVVATSLHLLADQLDLDNAPAIQAACGLQIEASTRDLLQAKLATLRPVLEQLAKLGSKAAKG